MMTSLRKGGSVHLRAELALSTEISTTNLNGQHVKNITKGSNLFRECMLRCPALTTLTAADQSRPTK